MAENKGQDSAVPVVVHLDGRIDAKSDWLFNDRSVLARDTQGDILARLDIIGQTEDVGNLRAVQDPGFER